MHSKYKSEIKFEEEGKLLEYVDAIIRFSQELKNFEVILIYFTTVYKGTSSIKAKDLI